MREQSNSLFSKFHALKDRMHKIAQTNLTNTISNFRNNLKETQENIKFYQKGRTELLSNKKIAGNLAEWTTTIQALTDIVETAEVKLIMYLKYFEKQYKYAEVTIHQWVNLHKYSKADNKLNFLEQIFTKTNNLIENVSNANKRLREVIDNIQSATAKNNKILSRIKKIASSHLPEPENDIDEEVLNLSLDKIKQLFLEIEKLQQAQKQKKEMLVKAQQQKQADIALKKQKEASKLSNNPILPIPSSSSYWFRKSINHPTVNSVTCLTQRLTVQEEIKLLEDLLNLTNLQEQETLYRYALLGTLARLMEHYKNNKDISPFKNNPEENDLSIKFRHAVFHAPEIINKATTAEVLDLSLKLIHLIKNKAQASSKTDSLSTIESELFYKFIDFVQKEDFTQEICKAQLLQSFAELKDCAVANPLIKNSASGFIHARISTYASALKNINMKAFRDVNKNFEGQLDKYIQLGNQYRHEAFVKPNSSINNLEHTTEEIEEYKNNLRF
ncbi:MAG: hypothetical protein JWM09_1085 [Francisellaceae bacterium]|nr:hypothetical protein [Francisellaceae bacterium]